MAEKGQLLVLQKGVVSGETTTWTTIANARSNSYTINGETVDVSNKSSAGMREILATAGIRSLSTSIAGVFTENAQINALETAALAGTVDLYRISTASKTITFSAAVTSYESGGEHNGEVTFSASLESSGAVTIADVA